jgi:branched-chain amino acid transport system ATP-binding protein
MPETPEPLLETVDLAAGYNGVPAIRGLSLSVGPGEVVALLGPNGAGKTTSLLAMVGLVPLLGGEVRVLGAPLGRRKPHQIARSGVLLVPDDRGIFGWPRGRPTRSARPRCWTGSRCCGTWTRGGPG